MDAGPTGSYLIETEPELRGSVFALALSALEDAPVDMESIASLRLPYPPSQVYFSPGEDFCALDTYLGWTGFVLFTHPDRTGPLTVSAVALVQLGSPGQLLAVGRLNSPVSSPSPGYTVKIPLSHMALSPT